jgi:hypothetical protein
MMSSFTALREAAHHECFTADSVKTEIDCQPPVVR